MVQLRVFPNPSPSGAMIQLENVRDGRVWMAVYDPSGRLVRKIADGEVTAGVHNLVWDGRDDAGRRVASGVYLVRAWTNQGSTTARVVTFR